MSQDSSGKYILWLNVAAAGLFWFLCAAVLYRRIAFIITNGGMERSDGSGSPAAFLFGMAIEAVFTSVPAMTATITAFFLLRKRRRGVATFGADLGDSSGPYQKPSGPARDAL